MAEIKFYGDKFRELVEARGYTLAEFYKKHNLSRFTIYQWISNKRNPKRSGIEAIARALQCRIDEISNLTEDEDVWGNISQRIDNEIDRDFVYKQIIHELKRQSHKTSQLELGNKLGISGSYISRLISGDARVEDFKIGAFFNLFPHMEISLNITIDDKTVSVGVKDRLHRFIDALTDEQALDAEKLLQEKFHLNLEETK